MITKTLNSPNHNLGRQNNTVDFIILHTSGSSAESGINTVLNTTSQVSYHFIICGHDQLVRTQNLQLKNGDIIQLVNINNTAWHAGTNNKGGSQDNSTSRIPLIRERRYNVNLYSIGIAFGDMPNADGVASPTQKQLESCVWLINHINNKLPAPIPFENIIGHVDVVPRHRPSCPGVRFPWDRLREMLNDNGGEKEMTEERVEAIITEKFNGLMDAYLRSIGNKPASNWAQAELQEAQNIGITDGTRPQEFVTREQSAVMALRAFRLKNF